MKLSYNWLQDFVELSDTDVNTVADKLTMGAFEVESIEKVGDKLNGDVVLGEIVELQKHPNADKLNLTKTRIGDKDEDVYQIVCGASNIAVGQKVPVATLGSEVINRMDGSMLAIKKSKIRGVESFGMLCAPTELGLSEAAIKSLSEEEKDGILILSDPNNPKIKDKTQGMPIGSDIRKVLNFGNDHVLHVGARSNRGDALSVLGQAREIAALFNRKASYKGANKLKDIKNIKIDKSIKSIKPAIEDENDCAVFHTLAVENLKICESPDWLKQRIEAMGTRSINNVVDVSNYVLHELGQPMHFYDREIINGDTLTSRRARAGEKVKTLDEQDFDLTDNNLVIADAKGPEAIAGVMGGFNSQITDSTTNIVIESAAFNPATVRRSSRIVGLESESKKRFERGVDKTKSERAVVRAVQLLAEIASSNGEELVVGELLTAGQPKAAEQKVKLPLDQIKRYLGIEIDKKIIIELLDTLEIHLAKESKGSLEFNIPSFRQNDITRAEDLVEEIGRLYGFDQIPEQAPSKTIGTLPELEQEVIKKRAHETLFAYGFSQAILSSLIGDTLSGLESIESNNGSSSPSRNAFAKIFDPDKEIRMLNPLSREHCVLRQSLMPGLIQAASRNYSYDKTLDVKLFEVGRAYQTVTRKELTVNEQVKIAAIMVANDNSWKLAKPQAEDFFKLKIIAEELYPRAKFKKIDDSNQATDLFHPGISAIIEEDKREIGYIGKVHPSICKEWDLPLDTYIFEANLPKKKKIKYSAIANTPIIERDITADIAANIDSDQISALIKKAASKDLVKISIVSLYQASPETTEKSVSYRLKWQSPSETLSGEAIDKEIQDIKSLLEKELGAKFRG